MPEQGKQPANLQFILPEPRTGRIGFCRFEYENDKQFCGMDRSSNKIRIQRNNQNQNQNQTKLAAEIEYVREQATLRKYDLNDRTTDSRFHRSRESNVAIRAIIARVFALNDPLQDTPVGQRRLPGDSSTRRI